MRMLAPRPRASISTTGLADSRKEKNRIAGTARTRGTGR